MPATQIEFPLHVDLGEGWHQVDSGYYVDGHTSVFIVTEGGKATILDAAHSAATPRILEVLGKIGLEPDAVDHVVVSHAHLDHCGGVGSLMSKLPNAKCVVHGKAAPHIADPEKLIAGARQVYGERYDSLYGEVLPVDGARIHAASDGETLQVGERRLEVLDTPGHTFSHLCVLDRVASCIFAGDVFGVTIPSEFGLKDAMRVPAAPTQFSPKDWKESVNRILALGVAKIAVAHYGVITSSIEEKAKELINEIDAFIELAKEAKDMPDPTEHIAGRIRDMWVAKIGEGVRNLPNDMLENDVNLVKLGLSLWMTKHLANHNG